MAVIDVDDPTLLPELEEILPELNGTTRVRTRRGYHYYFSLNGEYVKSTNSLFGRNLELKSNGTYVVAPSSTIKAHQYVYEVPLSEMLPIPRLLIKKDLSACSKLIRITYYSARFDSKGHGNFLTVLKRTGFKLVTKNLKTIFNGEYNINKANFDVEITLDAVHLIDQYDTLVLFSGDSDFDYLVKYLRANNKKVIVVSTGHHISNELVICCLVHLKYEN